MRRNPTKEEHYYQIMKVLEPWVPENQLEAWVFSIVQRFKRRDRIQYMLMMARFKAVLRLLETVQTRAPDPKGVKKLQAIYWKYLDTYADSNKFLMQFPDGDAVAVPKFPNRLTLEEEQQLWSMLQQQTETLTHLMDTMETGQYATAQAVIWSKQPINDQYPQTYVLVDAIEKAIEKDRSLIQDDYILSEDIPMYGGEIFVNCGGGFAWRALVTDRQRTIEAQLMNHCAAPQKGIILSLRENVPGKGLRPHLTFEYVADQTEDLKNSVGTLGEMKGYANSEPADRYHEQIICLLAMPNILGVVGGSYQRDKDFSLLDLNPENTQKLRQLRPDLFNENTLLKLRGVDLYRWGMIHVNKNLVMEDGQIIGPVFSDVIDAYEYIIDKDLLADCSYASYGRSNLAKDLEHLVGFLSDPGTFSMSMGDNYGRSHLVDLIKSLKPKVFDQFKEVFLKLTKAVYPQLTIEDVNAVWEAFHDEDWEDVPEEILDKVNSAGRNAEEIGWEVGTQDSMYKILKEILPLPTNMGAVTEKGFLHRPSELLLEGTQGDTSQTITYEECRRVARIIHRAGDQQDFDADAAVEAFLDHLENEIP